MVTKALAKMKSGKAAGPSGIIIEMLKAAGSKGIVFLREFTKSVVKHGKIPEDWEMSFILNLYKGKGDALFFFFFLKNIYTCNNKRHAIYKVYI